MDSALVIHVGAGKHSSALSRNFKKILRSALETNNVCEASRIIENSPLTNTGFGSCLDRSGNATSDASLYEITNGRITSSLALLGIDNNSNPTSAIFEVLQQLENEHLKGNVDRLFGLSKPSVLDYTSYLHFLKGSGKYLDVSNERNQCVAGHTKKHLISKKAKSAYRKFKAIYDSENNKAKSGEACQTETDHISDDVTPLQKKPRTDLYLRKDKANTGSRAPFHHVAYLGNLENIQDTVGYIEFKRSSETPPRTDTRLVTSSGGNFFRVPGRISCAGIPGAGIGYCSCDGIEISCMCSGNGDDIIGMNLAAYLSDSIAESLSHNKEWPDLGSLLVSRIKRKSKTITKTAVNDNLEEIIYVGVIMLVRTKSVARLVYCHSTESFYFAFRSREKNEIVLSQNPSSAGHFIYGEYTL